MTGNPVKMKISEDNCNLLEQARVALHCAYAPYSKFKVGAALLTSDNVVFKGCNVENASFGLTVCAERVAIGTAVANGKKNFKAIAVVSSGKTPPFPCGACLQVISEFCDPAFIFILGCAKKDLIKKYKLKDLLPNAFGPGKK